MVWVAEKAELYPDLALFTLSPSSLHQPDAFLIVHGWIQTLKGKIRYGPSNWCVTPQNPDIQNPRPDMWILEQPEEEWDLRLSAKALHALSENARCVAVLAENIGTAFSNGSPEEWLPGSQATKSQAPHTSLVRPAACSWPDAEFYPRPGVSHGLGAGSFLPLIITRAINFVGLYYEAPYRSLGTHRMVVVGKSQHTQQGPFDESPGWGF